MSNVDDVNDVDDVNNSSECHLEQEEDDDHYPEVRLQSGIDMKDVLESRSVFLHPNTDSKKDEATSVWKDYENPIIDIPFDSDESDTEDLCFKMKAQRMTDLDPDGLIKKRLLRTGLESYGQVPDNALVTVHYSLYCDETDEPFDSTSSHGKPKKIHLNTDSVICGLEVAIKSMKKKEKSEFIIHYSLAFGETGAPPRICPKSNVYAKIEVIDFVHEMQAEGLLLLDTDRRNEKFNFEKIFPVAKLQHNEGNNHVRQKEWRFASRKYERAIRLLEDVKLGNEDEENNQKKFLLKLYLNLGYCYIKLLVPSRACVVLQKCLIIDFQNTKGNYRLGLAKRMLGNHKDAMRFLSRAQKSDALNVSIRNEIDSLKKEMEIDLRNQKVMCKRMLGIN